MPMIESPLEAHLSASLQVFLGRTEQQRQDITRGVQKHCQRIGCDQSNTIAAVAWALRTPGDPLSAVRAGRQRAAQLLHRQPAAQL